MISLSAELDDQEDDRVDDTLEDDPKILPVRVTDCYRWFLQSKAEDTWPSSVGNGYRLQILLETQTSS